MNTTKIYPEIEVHNDTNDDPGLKYTVVTLLRKCCDGVWYFTKVESSFIINYNNGYSTSTYHDAIRKFHESIYLNLICGDNLKPGKVFDSEGNDILILDENQQSEKERLMQLMGISSLTIKIGEP